MGLFDIFKKSTKPYKDPATNLVYELLFCDNLDRYKNDNDQPHQYPWSILFDDGSTEENIVKLLADSNIESRIKILACNKLTHQSQNIADKELFGVIVELGLDNGLDVLASYSDGTARYINQTGKMIIWESADDFSTTLTQNLFQNSYEIIKKIGPWDQPRKPHPAKDTVRITFLVSDGLYFGEGPINLLFNDPMAGPALASAAQLMKYLIDKAA